MNRNRRNILQASLGAAAAISLGTFGTLGSTAISHAQPRMRKHRIGHTGITWGYPAANAEQAVADVARLGYHGFESFGSVLENWESRGGLGRLLEAASLPLVGAYCPMVLTDAARRRDEVAKIVRWARLIEKYGGRIAVIGPDNVDRARFDFNAARASIVASLNEIGAALADVGIVGALHQHTGSCITTRDETYAVMESVNTDVVKLCPDTGELLAGGLDPVRVVRDFLDVVAHVHIKDYDGGDYNDGYCPVGTGRVDVAGVVDVLESSDADFMIMAELNPNTRDMTAPATPFELARSSRARFVELGYRFRAG